MAPLSTSQYTSHHYSPKVTITPASRFVRAVGDDTKPHQKCRQLPRCSKILEPLLAWATLSLEATPPSLIVAPPSVIFPSSLFWFWEFGLLCFCSCGWAWWLGLMVVQGVEERNYSSKIEFVVRWWRSVNGSFDAVCDFCVIVSLRKCEYLTMVIRWW